MTSIDLPPITGDISELSRQFVSVFGKNSEIDRMLLDNLSHSDLAKPISIAVITPITDLRHRARIKVPNLVSRATEEFSVRTCDSSIPLRFALALDECWCLIPNKIQHMPLLIPIGPNRGIRMMIRHVATALLIEYKALDNYNVDPHEPVIFEH